MGGSSDFFMWDQAWNCWLMHVRKVAVDRNSSTGAGSQGDASKQSAANGRAGLNTCATIQASISMIVVSSSIAIQ